VINIAADVAAIIGNTAEFGATASIGGIVFSAIGVQSFQGLNLGGLAVEGNITRLFTTVDELASAGGAIGSPVVYRAVSYTLSHIERHDGELVLLELQR